MDVHVELPEELIEQLEKQTGVRITEYRIDFYGYRSVPARSPADTLATTAPAQIERSDRTDVSF